MYNKKNERMQHKLDAGFVSKHYPDVKSIIINMQYNQKGIAKPIRRVVNFAPDSYALFKVDCLTRECVDGGFDLTKIIRSMIRNHKKAVKGELRCKNNGLPANHSDIIYEVAIKYS